MDREKREKTVKDLVEYLNTRFEKKRMGENEIDEMEMERSIISIKLMEKIIEGGYCPSDIFDDLIEKINALPDNQMKTEKLSIACNACILGEHVITGLNQKRERREKDGQ